MSFYNNQPDVKGAGALLIIVGIPAIIVGMMPYYLRIIVGGITLAALAGAQQETWSDGFNQFVMVALLECAAAFAIFILFYLWLTFGGRRST